MYSTCGVVQYDDFNFKYFDSKVADDIRRNILYPYHLDFSINRLIQFSLNLYKNEKKALFVYFFVVFVI